jgi:5-methylcytosine-specific restriction endonuclease McrA
MRRALNWSKNNREKRKSIANQWARSNKQHCLENGRKWRRENPQKARLNYRLNSLKRRTRLAENGGSLSKEEWITLCDKYRNKCVCCGQKRKLTIDHIVPVSKGGSSNIENIQPLCQPCNSRKGIRIIDYRR